MALHTPVSAGLYKETIRVMAGDLGFVRCGFTSAEPMDLEDLLDGWLRAGRHGYMSYLAGNTERRLSPRSLLDKARSVVVAAWPYPAAAPNDDDWKTSLKGRIAAYALGTDYHIHVREKLEQLAGLINDHVESAWAVQVDSGPLLEKELARRAGIGWYGRNTNIISTYNGSYLLLGCLVTNLELERDEAQRASHCGTCTECIPSCPTGALDHGPTIDAPLCVSYLTIEHRGPIEPSLRPQIGNWVFGCDVCQQVCPWNEATPEPPSELTPYLPDLISITDDEFRARYKHTAVSRSKRRGLARNAAVALGNTGNRRAVEPLADALCAHDEALVRAHAAWALGRIGGSQAGRALRAARRQTQAPPVASEIDGALQRLG